MVSIIIPTFKRSSEVLVHSLKSILADQSAFGFISEIIVVDQNIPELDIPSELKDHGYLKFSAHDLGEGSKTQGYKILHIVNQPPSLTKAQNLGVRFAQGEFLIFFDDDVSVIQGTIENYIKLFQENPSVSFLAGRETLPEDLKKESSVKSFLRKFVRNVYKSDVEYQIDGNYVCKINSNSFILANFDQETTLRIKVDGARGCNWACRTDAFRTLDGFDEAYQGTALRGETDLQVRMSRKFGPGIYAARSRVIHHRQLGGCENLSTSLKSLKSKFENEAYFQSKNFKGVSRLFFLVRTMPLMLSSLKESKCLSLLIWLKYGFRVNG